MTDQAGDPLQDEPAPEQITLEPGPADSVADSAEPVTDEPAAGGDPAVTGDLASGTDPTPPAGTASPPG